MSSLTAAAGPNPYEDYKVPLWRLYVMRALALLFVVSGFSNYLPEILNPGLDQRGMLHSMLTGLWLVSFIALRHPLLMVPMYLFEIVWKTAWLLAYGLPQWTAGRVTDQLRTDMFEIGFFPFVFALVIPWGYVWRRYIKAPGDRWR